MDSSPLDMWCKVPSEKSEASGSLRNAHHPQEVIESLNKLRLHEQLCDVVILVEGERFPAHRVVLAANTPYFEAMFSSNLEESRQKTVTIKEVKSEAVREIIDYCYTSTVHIDNSNVEGLLSASCLLQVRGVTGACCEFMKTQLDSENCLSVRAFAEAHSCQELVQVADAFVHEHCTEVFEGEEFLRLNSRELASLLESDQLNVPNEEQVFESVMKWAQVDVASRRQDLHNILCHVRLPLLSPSYLVSRVSSDPLIRGDQQCRDLIDEAKDYLLLPDQREHLQGPRTRPRRSTRQNELLYAVGGWCSGDAISMVECYDLKSNEWSVVPAMSKRRCGVGVAVLNDFLYAIGGHDGVNYLNSIERYDPKTRQWSSSVPSTSTCRTSFGVAVLDDSVYAVGGQDGTSCLKHVEKYNPKENKWTSVSPMLSRRLGVAVAVLDGHLYAVGGSDGSAPVNTVERYDPGKNTWEFVAPMSCRRKHLGAAALNGKLYAVGGRSETTELNTVECYDPSANQWFSVVGMSTRRSGVGLQVVSNRLFAVGGFDGSSYLRTVEWYDPSTNMWRFTEPMKYRRLGGGVGVLLG